MPIALIVAAAGENRVIGLKGDLPWHFRSDLKFFKETTLGHTVLMGRTTYQSILKRLGKPLPGRENIVATRDWDFKDARAHIVHSLDDLQGLAAPGQTLFVIGGDSIYKQAMDVADTIYYTHIEQEVAGDAFFPAIDPEKWELASERPEEENGVKLFFRTYTRKK